MIRSYYIVISRKYAVLFATFFIFSCEQSNNDKTFTWSEDSTTFTNSIGESFNFSYELSITHSPNDKTVYYKLGRTCFDHLRVDGDFKRSKNDLKYFRFEDLHGNILHEWEVPNGITSPEIKTDRTESYRVDRGKGLNISRTKLQRTSRLVPGFYLSFDEILKSYYDE